MSARSARRRRFTSAATSSVPLRLRQKAMVRCPPVISALMSSAVSRADEVERPPSTSSPAGFQSTKTRSPRGEPSSVTSSTGRPHSSEARRPGSPMVAEVNTKVGDEP